MTNLAFPPQQLHPDEDEKLGQQITLLAGQINAANHRLLKLVAEFDRRKAWSAGGTVRSCAHWLNWKCGIAMVAAGMGAPDDDNFAIAIIQVVISVVGWVQTAITYAYLPELTDQELLLGEWTKNFTMLQFASMVLYLAVIIGSISVAGRGDDDLLTSQVAMSVAFAVNATILPVVWGKLFKRREPLHQLPDGRSLWTMGFIQLWNTSRHIAKNAGSKRASGASRDRRARMFALRTSPDYRL